MQAIPIPFGIERMMSVLAEVVTWYAPTAQMLVAEAAEMPFTLFAEELRFGVESSFHAAPFQLSINVLEVVVLLKGPLRLPDRVPPRVAIPPWAVAWPAAM